MRRTLRTPCDSLKAIRRAVRNVRRALRMRTTLRIALHAHLRSSTCYSRGLNHLACDPAIHLAKSELPCEQPSILGMRGNLHFERSATQVRRTWHPTLRPTCESEMRGHSHGGSTSKSLRAIRTLANCIASCLATHVRGFGVPANRLATHPAIGPRPYRSWDQIEV